jgi:hypothetical protein
MPRRSDLALLVIGLGCLGLGCEERPAPRGPDVVVQEFLRGLRSAHGNPEAGAKVVELLWKPARDNLAERAARASALSGRELEPGEMIAPSWLSLALLPEQFEWRQDGAWAEVRVTAADGRSMSTRCARARAAFTAADPSAGGSPRVDGAQPDHQLTGAMPFRSFAWAHKRRCPETLVGVPGHPVVARASFSW